MKNWVSPYPAIAAMVIPQIAELVLQHVRSTSFLSAEEDKPSSHTPPASSSAALSSAPLVCSDPSGVGEKATA